MKTKVLRRIARALYVTRDCLARMGDALESASEHDNSDYLDRQAALAIEALTMIRDHIAQAREAESHELAGLSPRAGL